MKKFQQAEFPDDSMTAMMSKNFPYESVWLNDKYQVIVYDCKKVGMQSEEFPDLLWLSIKRIDKAPIRDWMELQRIKNMIVGAEHEAVELFPAESRLVNTSNQFHLFVLKDKSIKFPFGWMTRLVMTQKDLDKQGLQAKQRDLK